MFENSNEIFEAIEYIASVSSTKEKEELLTAFLGDEPFRWVVRYALEPLVTYGVLKMPETGQGDGQFDPGTWNLIEALSTRQLTGHAAQDALRDELARLDGASQELLKRLLTKDLRAGIGAAIVNKAAKKSVLKGPLISEFPYMRCSLPKHVKLDEWPWHEGVDSQVKMDGMFASLSIFSDRGRTLHSRAGQQFDMRHSVWDALRREINALPTDIRFSGELCIMKDGLVMPRKTGNGLLNSLLKGKNVLPDKCSIGYTVWDVMPLNTAKTGIFEMSHTSRMKKLREILGFAQLKAVSIVESKTVFSYEEAQEHAEEIQEKGGEGTVIKHPKGIWKKGTSKHEVKLKAEHTADLRMIKLVPGTGKNEKTFGSIRCATDDGLVFVDVSGFSDAMREEIFRNWEDKYEYKIMEVKFNELINAKNRETFSLFLPRYEDFRFDKDETDTYNTIKAMK